MKNSKHAWIAAAALFAVCGASAQSMKNDSGYYGELGYTTLKLDDGISSPTPKLARLIAGKNINENLDVEGMLAFTVSKDTWVSNANSDAVSSKNLGIYAKPKMVMTRDTEIFGRIGLSHTSWKNDSTGGNTSGSFTKLGYGVGVQTQFTKDVYSQLDYMDFGEKDGVSAKGFTISVGTRF